MHLVTRVEMWILHSLITLFCHSFIADTSTIADLMHKTDMTLNRYRLFLLYSLNSHRFEKCFTLAQMLSTLRSTFYNVCVFLIRSFSRKMYKGFSFHVMRLFTLNQPSTSSQVVKLLTCIWEETSSNLGRDTDCPNVLRDFSKCILTNFGKVPQTRLRPLPSKIFLSHYSPTGLPFDAMKSELLAVSLNKLNSVAFSPQANYTDRATAACRRS
jgi:hypothetical protein